jgi:tetratricopeptide (TPR) repeat protein
MHQSVLLEVVFLIVGVFVAEAARSLGRVLLGTVSGLRASHLTVGVGPVLFRTRFAGCVWIWRGWPIRIEPNWHLDNEPELLKRRLWLMTLGGPLAYVGVIAIVKAAGVPLTRNAGAMLPIQLIATASSLMLIGRLLPIDLGSGQRQAPTDGLQLWRCLRASVESLRDALVPCVRFEVLDDLAQNEPAAALELCDRGIAAFSTPWIPEMRRLKALALGRLGRAADAASLAAMNLDIELPPASRGVALNDWCWFAFCHRDENDLRLADARSAEALALRPELGSVAGTRGAVLLWRGRVTEAIPLLERAVARAKGPHSRAVNNALLAIAHASRGQSARAQEYLDAARAQDPREPLLPEAERSVAAAATSTRLLFATRGHRALLVDPDGIELLEGVVERPESRDALRSAARVSRRLTLSEIAAVRVGRSSRGRPLLIVVQADRRAWRLPLATSDLSWARMLAEDILSPTRPIVELPTAPRKTFDVERAVVMGLGFFVTASMMFGPHIWQDLEIPQFLLVSVVMVIRPAAPAALAFGTSILTAVAMALGNEPTLATVLENDAAIVLALIALAAGIAFRRRPRIERDGFGLTLGALGVEVALAAFPWIVLTLRHAASAVDFGLGKLVPMVVASLVVVAWGRGRR